MGLAESFVPRVVTGKTELQGILRQQVRLGGTVSHVTGAASLVLDDAVYLLAGEGLPIVALEADIAAAGVHHEGVVRGMRIVTGRALPLAHGAVDALLVQTQIFLAMAGEADLVPRFLQQQLGNDAVRQVAFLAFLLLDHRMNMLLGQKVFVKVLVTVDAALAAEGTLGRLGLSDGDSRREGDDHRRQDCHPYPVFS